MGLQKEIKELEEAGIIDGALAERIRSYYAEKAKTAPNRLLIIFSVLGALLVGLGLILIVAHNWDAYSKLVKTVLALLPMAMGQLACAYTLWKQNDSKSWREGSATFLFISIGVALSMIAQVYNISGSLSSFLLNWALLGLPIVYVMRSSMAAFIYLVMITYFGQHAGYWNQGGLNGLYYWPMLAALVPHYLVLLKQNKEHNNLLFFNWLVSLSLVICFGMLVNDSIHLFFIGYMGLLSLFIHMERIPQFIEQMPSFNGFARVGYVGQIVLLLVLSFDELWDEIRREGLAKVNVLAIDSLVVLLIMAMIAFLLIWLLKKPNRKMDEGILLFPLFFLVYVFGIYVDFAVVLMNLLVLALSLRIIVKGLKIAHLGTLNFGLLSLTALIACRYFDMDLSFVLRGIVFVIVGVGFFLANMYIIKSRKQHES